MSEHSPLPWEHVAATDHHGAYIVSASGLDVCDLYAMSNPSSYSVRNGGDSRPIPFVDMDENARHIVKCVNAFPDLVKALEMSRDFLDPDRGPPRMSNREMVEMINGALAAVKGVLK